MTDIKQLLHRWHTEARNATVMAHERECIREWSKAYYY